MSEEKPLLDLIIDYEDGDLESDEVIRLFQRLVDTGIVWELQSHYQRMASNLLRLGIINPKE